MDMNNDFRNNRRQNRGMKRSKGQRFNSNSRDSMEWVDNVCKETIPLKNQISLIIAQIEAEPYYYRNIPKICEDLTHCLKHFRLGKLINISPFGSGVSKLALKNSDVDIYLQFKDDFKGSPKKFLHCLKACISRQRDFHNACAIPARVPIVQCQHRSGISCDLSFVNGLGVSNSNLIKFLLTRDDRIRPLILILKFFFKKNGLIGVNFITSYTLTALVLYFLQQLEEPLIPAVSFLQKHAKYKETTVGWDTSFTTDATLIPAVENQSSVAELLHQFFKFYSTFEFGFYVISIFTGKTYLKPTFSSPDLLPEDFKLYKENVKKDGNLKYECMKSACVQGPFNHSHNIARGVSYKVLNSFQNICYDSWKICESSLKNENQSELFKNLFAFNVTDEYKKLKINKKVDVFVGESINLDSHDCSEETLRNQWSESILSTVNEILVNILKCKVEIVPPSDFDTVDVIQLMKCELNHFLLVTKERHKVKNEFDFSKNLTPMEQEKLISDYLVDTDPIKGVETSFKFTITCFLKKSPTYMSFLLSHEDKSKEAANIYPQIFKFIQWSFSRCLTFTV